MAEAMINSSVLRWATDRSHADAADLASSVNVKDVTRVQDWLTGERRPTFRQAQNLAKALRIPFGYLFLDAPPHEVLPIPDLRTLGDSRLLEVSPDLREVLTDVQFKFDWYKDALLDAGAEPLDFVGSFRLPERPERVATAITAALSLTMADRADIRSWEEFYRLLCERCEDLGIWILANGVVGNNTHRALNVEEFRGFAIADPICPLVFINNRDAKAAQIFTLVHELAHIWIGQSGISDQGVDSDPQQPYSAVETFCNRVAAEVLVPTDALTEQWDTEADKDNEVRRQARYFRVSGVMLARRCLDLGLVDWAWFRAFYDGECARWANKPKGGGDYYVNVRIRNGRRFMDAVLSAAVGGRLLYRDAGRLLNINPSKIHEQASRQGT